MACRLQNIESLVRGLTSYWWSSTNFKKLFGDYRRLLYNVRSFYAGVLSVGETPVPIPNTAVKPHGGYNT